VLEDPICSIWKGGGVVISAVGKGDGAIAFLDEHALRRPVRSTMFCKVEGERSLPRFDRMMPDAQTRRTPMRTRRVLPRAWESGRSRTMENDCETSRVP